MFKSRLFVCPAFNLQASLEEDFYFQAQMTSTQSHYSCSFAYSTIHYY